MQISGSGTVPPIQLRLPAQALQGIALRDGAILNATVRQSEPSGQLTLEISGKLLQAVSTLQLAAGISLQLRVEKTTDGIFLHLDETERQRLMYQEALRRELPRQESLRPLVRQLMSWQTAAKSVPQAEAKTVASPGSATLENTATTQTAGNPATSLPQPVVQAINRLLAILPSLEALVRPDGLQRAIARSGLFLENQLLSSARPTELDGDVKVTLLRLAQVIRQQLGESKAQQSVPMSRETSQESLQNLLRQIEAGIARIQLHQLNALSGKAEGEERLNLTLELPFHQPQSGEMDLLQIRIRRDGNKRSSKDAGSWTVNLHFTPEGYGDIHAVVNLNNGKVSTTFWCAEESTAQLFREQLHLLQERLQEQGLEISQCTSRYGRPADAIMESMGKHNGLIDTKA